MKSMKYLLPLAALALSGIASAGARDTHSVVVKFGDLNLNSQTGIANLHQRIRNAARSVCGPLDTRNLALRAAYTSCVEEAVAGGVAAVGNSSLTQFHASKSGVLLASNQG